MSIQLTLGEGRDLLVIDKNNLDEVVMQQPSIFYSIAEQHILSLGERDAAKEALSEVDAILTSEFRIQAEEAKEKTTEAKLSQKVQIDKGHNAHKKHYATSKLRAERWGILRESFSQRASMIKHLCELYNNEYFAREAMVKDKNVSQVRRKGRERLINKRSAQ